VTDTARIDLALVIISLRGMDATRTTLRSVQEHCPLPEPHQTQAIFGGATEVDAAHLVELGIAYEIIEGRVGLAEALGNCVASFDREWILMIGDDVVLEDGWYEPIADYLDEHPEAVVVTPTIKVGEHEQITGVPAEGDSVCVLVNRTAMAEGRLRQVVQVNESEVSLAGDFAVARASAH